MTTSEYGSDQPDAETLLRRAIEVINNGKSVPLSTSVLISSREEVLDLLEGALERLPEELRQARWMMRERQEHLERVQREADEILDAARVRAERLVQRTEIVREAQHTASRLLAEAKEASSRLRHEAEDYCDQKLASFEIVLERTMRSVQAGRNKLQAAAPPPEPEEAGPGLLGRQAPEPLAHGSAQSSGAGFFDQDQT